MTQMAQYYIFWLLLRITQQMETMKRTAMTKGAAKTMTWALSPRNTDVPWERVFSNPGDGYGCITVQEINNIINLCVRIRRIENTRLTNDSTPPALQWCITRRLQVTNANSSNSNEFVYRIHKGEVNGEKFYNSLVGV